MAGKPRLRRAIGKRSVGIVVEEMHRGAHVVTRDRQVQEPVVFEILGDHAIRHGRKIQTHCGSHVDKSADSLFRFERRRGNQILPRNAGRVFSDGHIGKIEKPFHLHLIGPFWFYLQIFQKILNGFLRIVCHAIRLGEARRKETPISRIAINIVLHF